EEVPSAGCCTNFFDDRSESLLFSNQEVVSVRDRPVLSAAFFVCNLAVALALIGLLMALRRQRLPPLSPVLFGALVNLAVGGVSLVEVASPILLGQPWHHCPYDLIPDVPTSTAAVALFLWATFSVGWAAIARCFGDTSETRPLLPRALSAIFLMALVCY